MVLVGYVKSAFQHSTHLPRETVVDATSKTHEVRKALKSFDGSAWVESAVLDKRNVQNSLHSEHKMSGIYRITKQSCMIHLPESGQYS